MKANNTLYLKKNTKAQVGIGTLIIFIAMVLVAAVAAAVLIQTSGTLQQKAQSTGKQATQEVSSNLMVKTIEGVRAKNSATDMSSTIDLLKLKVGLNVGSSPVDVNQVVISITDGTTANNLVYAGNEKSYASTGQDNGDMDNFGSSASENLANLLVNSTTASSSFNNSDNYYTVEKIRDEDSSFSQGNPVMNTGDLITVYISTISDSAVSAGYSTLGTTNVSSGMKTSGLNLVPRTTVNIVLTPESGAATTSDFVAPSSYGVKETVQLYP
ncbi:archaellin/type IV pilin N-terminal domain-containing protein [Methanolobus bombayensis]|uniref:archaellin/type IV pilin N-terminal domain-containing protein n=1 Tax=Methanolobus bombayensis TaxID=38023 RepID=UPI001AE44C82|nr:archaellin/type IV pilin N-terminal domain-containing protein [Methanolobus bombayensis]MBP1910241.1 flagellin FlaB [Methanolobus bombayensis]